MNHIIPQEYVVSREVRNRLNEHNSFVIWFTGLSGSGKSTIANHLEQELVRQRIRTFSLDGDNIRTGLNEGLSFSIEDRRENNRRISEVARLFVDAGIVAITAFISPLKEDRARAKNIIGDRDFLEIFIDTPLDVCERRDVKGLYNKARKGEISNFTGIDSPYEPPESPFLTIKTQEETVQEAVGRILKEIEVKLRLP